MNNRQMKYVLIMCLGIGVTFNTRAQNQEKVLSLKQAIKYALDNNTKATKAKLDEEESKFNIKEVRSQTLPQITASGNFDDNLNIPVQLLPGEIVGAPGTTVEAKFGQQYTVSGGLEVNQTLFDKSVLGAMKAADAANKFYALNTTRSKEEVIFQITTDYYQTLILEENLHILKANQEKMIKLIEMAGYQQQAGVIKTIDLNRLKVNRTNGETQIQNLESDLTTQLNTMKYHMGMAINENIRLDGSTDTLNETIINNALEEGDLSNGRYDYLIIKQQQLLNTLEVKNFKAGYYPTLSAYARQSYNAQRNEFNFFDGSQPWFPTTIVGMRLSIPLFDGFKKNAQVQQSKIRLQKLDQDEADVKRAINLEYQNALSQLKNSSASMEAQRENVELAQEVYTITEDSYKQGITPLSDLLNSETELLEANNNFNASLLRYKLAQLSILKAKGQLQSILN
ncbi:MAG TPA: TolC family protein [Cyclobacteriaceae bacterium]|nr:TolC family protein [Cyclobacteriaceae bacterium]